MIQLLILPQLIIARDVKHPSPGSVIIINSHNNMFKEEQNA